LADTPVRTLVVDDSALMRAMVSRMLRTDPFIEVVGVAKNGIEAIEKAASLRPDVVTLDIEMPEMDGISALKELTRRGLAKVVMLSAQQDADTVYAALASGAVDFVPKPSGPVSADIESLTGVITEKVRMAAGVDQEKVAAANEVAAEADAHVREDSRGAVAASAAMRARGLDRIVVIGASTGGPPAIEAVLAGLPAGLPVAVIVVQHLPGGFSGSFCRRLARSSRYPVREAVDGEKLEPGVVLVAPAGAHLEVVRRSHLGLVVRTLDEPALHGVRPAVDVTLKSIAKAAGSKTVGVVLTGMGADGAAGMTALKQAGGKTVVQDESTSVVFGMPSATIRAGAADRVVPLSRIAREILKAIE
jgi:two-component system chemotaxis response regulator CheB